MHDFSASKQHIWHVFSLYLHYYLIAFRPEGFDGCHSFSFFPSPKALKAAPQPAGGQKQPENVITVFLCSVFSQITCFCPFL